MKSLEVCYKRLVPVLCKQNLILALFSLSKYIILSFQTLGITVAQQGGASEATRYRYVFPLKFPRRKLCFHRAVIALNLLADFAPTATAVN